MHFYTNSIFVFLVTLLIHQSQCGVISVSQRENEVQYVSPYYSYLLSTKNLATVLMRSSQTDNINNDKMQLTPVGMNMAEYVKFYLYTRSNIEDYQELTLGGTEALENSNFNSSKDTFVLIHGYMNNINSDAIQLPKKSLLKTYDCNVIGVDWSRIAVTLLYNVAVKETRHVGDYLYGFLNYMVQSGGLALSKTHLVGHSLGAHVAGFAGKQLSPQRIARITGLDPAKPGFTDAGPTDRLNATDAQYVDCIHTCAGDLGFELAICQADFYPNGGTNPQPGCLAIDFLGTCSHERSVQLYAESVYPSHEFIASQCSSVPSASGANCSPQSHALMGQPATIKNQGIFYTTTNDKYPFSQTVQP